MKNNKSKTLLCNFFAGPGTGKSTVMAGVFSELKWRGVNCEMAPEFAKEKVWEKSINTLGNQIYVFGKQLHNIYRLVDQVDVIITDSPLLFSLIYAKDETPAFENLVLDVFNRYNNINFFLRRQKAYNPKGRLQTEDEAKEKDIEIKELLERHNICHSTLTATRDNVVTIADLVNDKLRDELRERK